MTIQEQIKQLTVESMKARDSVKTNVLKGLSAGFVNELVATGQTPQSPVTDEMATQIIKRQVKQRKDSIEQFNKGNRLDLAEKEQAELLILETFLPAQMSETDIAKIVDTKIAELGVADKSGIGKLIGAVMKETGGNADGAVIKKIIESKLA